MMAVEPEVATPWVVAIVLNYGLPEATADCVRSLQANDYPRLDLLVVDNGSTDDSVALLRARFPTLPIVEIGENRYFAGGMNVGLTQALEQGADYALVLNNDTLAPRDMVTRLVQVAEASHDAAAVAPLITDTEGRLWAAGARQRCGWPFPRNLGWADVRRAGGDQAIRVDYVTGCGILLRATALREVGLFDEGYCLYYEDADLCARLAEAGYTLWVAPAAKMTHLVSATAKRQAQHSVYLHTRYRLRFYRQHRQPLHWLGWALLLGQEVGRALCEGLTGRKDLGAARWRGLRDGWREPGVGADSAAHSVSGSYGI